MKLLRLALRHYRGIEEREIRFAERGVTLVQGPNEIGKSCIAEALDLIFDERADSKKQHVRRVQPVQRDEGAEIEVEVETGPYAFTYTKRFHLRPATTLHVSRPSMEHLTGREAHERVRAILAQTIDPVLWRALRIQQGQALDPPELDGQTALRTAFERAAGEAAGDARAESLVEAARLECERYFTPKTGAERDELRDARRVLEQSQREAKSLEAERDELEEALRRVEELRVERPQFERRLAASEAALREGERALERARSSGEALVHAEARRDATRAEEGTALHLSKERSQLLATLALAEAEGMRLEEALAAGEAPLGAAAASLEDAERDHERALAGRTACERRAATRRRDRDFRLGERELADLDARLARLARARDETIAAEAGLAGLAVDAAAVEAIQRAEMERERARVRVETEGPALHVTAERELSFHLDGRRVTVPAGESRELHVADSLLLEIPGVGDFALSAGRGLAEHRKVLEGALARHRELCANAGVDDHAGALRALETRRNAERILTECERVARECQGGFSPSALEEHAAALRVRVEAYPNERDPAEPPPTDTETAISRVEASEAELADANDAVRAAESRRTEAAERFQALDPARRDLETRLDLAREHRASQESRLAEAQRHVEDEDLMERRDACLAASREAEARVHEAREQLEACEPEAADVRAEAARLERSAAGRALERVREEALLATGRLEASGGTGLHERCEAARARAEQAAGTLARIERRAAAARLLRDTLEEAREQAQRGVAEPLREGIRTLGAELFGAGFDVTLDDELRIARRTLDGVSLDVEDLSVGAREQLALLARLACAIAVSGDGGAPVILDDALGHSDASRLAGLGRVIERAARDCQVIVLTCAPERYAHVGEARIVALH